MHFSAIEVKYVACDGKYNECLSSTSQFVGNPIHCWDLRGDIKNKDYADSLCWIQNTYKVYDEERWHQVQDDDTTRDDREVTYYQWVPLILLLQVKSSTYY